jgi:hypothetical protein
MNKFMKKAGFASVLVVALALVVVVAGVFAQGPSTPGIPNQGAQLRQANSPASGLGLRAVNEADMHTAIAAVLGMTLEEFEAAVAEGQTPYTLILDLGVDFANVQAAMNELHTGAAEQAMAGGIRPQNSGNMVGGPGNMSRGVGNMSRGSANQGGAGGTCLIAGSVTTP